VTRLARTLKREAQDGTPQIILYHGGVGSSSSKVEQFTGGAFGSGLDEVRQSFAAGYHFLVC